MCYRQAANSFSKGLTLMYVVQHLKRKYYAIFNPNNRITWHYVRFFATHFDNRDQAEARIEEVGLERDDYAIIEVSQRKR